jgi:Ion channel
MYRFNKIIKIILYYIVIYISINIIFGIIYFQISEANNIENSTFWDNLFFSVTSYATLGYNDLQPIPQMWLVITIQQIIASLITPILTGIAFYHIFNRSPKINFPKKLIVRRRTSEGSSNQLTLSVKVANCENMRMYDVKCQLIYFYFKETDNRITRNGETNFSQEICYIDKTFRFSFELEKFPIVLLEALLLRDGLNQKDKISIVISGKRGYSGGSFILDRDYFLKDVEIAKESKLLYTYYKENDEIKTSKINYTNLNEIISYPEKDRADVIKQLEKILNDKKAFERVRVTTRKSVN